MPATTRGRGLRSRFAKEPGHRAGAIDGLNLFFGALLGANLGTLAGLKLVHYLQLVCLLAALVMALRIVSTAEDRRKPLLVLAAYVVLLTGLAIFPDMMPFGLPKEDLHRLLATLGIWIGVGLIIEFSPTIGASTPTPGD
jgi:hypothetical protein